MKVPLKYAKLAIGLVPIMCVLGFATAASAAAPTGPYSVFAQCPLSNPSVNECVYAQTIGGEVTLGNTTVPLKKVQTLQGGIAINEETFEEAFVPAANGETLSKTPQTVPGGLIGLVKCEDLSGLLEDACKAVFENGTTGVTATTELVGPVVLSEQNLTTQEGTALQLPVRVHLSNPLLGSKCYIGSASEPITLNLITGTTKPPAPNEPISGAVGAITISENGSLTTITGNKLVENAFASPGVNGCEPFPLAEYVLDPLIDAKLALPSPAGKNTAILDNTIELAAAESVRKSE